MTTPAERQELARAESQRLWRLAAMGGTMASEILAGAMIGWLADLALKSGPRGLVIGSIAGVVIGMTTFIRSAVRESRQAGRDAARIAHAHDLEPIVDDGAEDERETGS